MLCPLKLRTTRLDSLLKKKKKVKENISVNYEEDNVSLVLSKIPAQKCFFNFETVEHYNYFPIVYMRK